MLWNREKFDEFSQDIMAYDWATMFDGFSVENNYSVFLSKYNDAVQKYIPSTRAPYIEKKDP